jgi:hypothetical protein
MSATEAVVYLGKMQHADIVREYYQRCGLETFKPTVKIPVKEILAFTTFEELVDQMLKRSEWVHVIVNHGQPEGGLLMPLAKGGGHNQTGAIMSDLAVLAQQKVCLRPDHPTLGGRIRFIAAGMGVKPETVTRVAEKLAMLQARKFIVEMRGCNVGKDRAVLDGYRQAFNSMTTAPSCRMFFLRIQPGRPPRGQTTAGLAAGRPDRPKTRRRSFNEPNLVPSGPIVIDITDLDGHTNVRPAGFMDDPHRASDWANRLLTVWRQAATAAGRGSFVLPVMWDDLEDTFHLPHEPGWSSKLVMTV